MVANICPKLSRRLTRALGLKDTARLDTKKPRVFAIEISPQTALGLLLNSLESLGDLIPMIVFFPEKYKIHLCGCSNKL